jgi:hypothetical protein
MKRIAILLVLNMLGVVVFSQNDTSKTEYQTIFKIKKNEKVKISGFGSITIDLGQADGNFASYFGGEGAVIFNRSFYMGFYGKGVMPTNEYTFNHYISAFDKAVEETRYSVFGHGGFLVGGIFNAEKPYHFGISSTFGVGSVGLINDYGNELPDYLDQDIFFFPVYVVTPKVDFEMNITYWFKFSLSASYQFVSDKSIYANVVDNGKIVEKEILNANTYSTPLFSVRFIFGWFK